MCGIAGIYYTDKNLPDGETASAMIEKLSHRGPDGEGFYFGKKIILAHKRLSIIDVTKTGRQPMTNEDGTVWIVQNGEIYNYLELREELIARGHVFKSKSDTEVIIHLYEEEGRDFVKRLNGMFAFTIWDSRTSTFFAARDRLGIKPYYYSFDGEKFIFASEIKAVIEAGVMPSLDEVSMTDYFTYSYTLEDRTFFKGIKKLLPGHTLEIKDGKIKLSKYWDLTFEDTGVDEETQAGEIKNLLLDSVRLQLRSDVPLGCHLSGGIDSSAITCLAAGLLKGNVATFSGAFSEGGEFDEREFARVVVKSAGTSHYEILPDSSDFAAVLEKIIYYLDEPVVGPGVFPQYFVSKLASEHVKVVLGGQGGDELFAGYPRYYESYEKLEQKPEKILGIFKKGRTLTQEEKHFKSCYEGNYNRFLKLMSDGFTGRIKEIDILERFLGSFPASEKKFMNKVFYFDIKNYLPGLLHVEDRTSMAVSLESRVPILDHRIAEIAARISPERKMKNGILKYMFRKAMKGIVPEEILSRTDKKGFAVPISMWFKDGLKIFVRDILLDERTYSRGIWKKDSLENLIKENSKNGRHYSTIWSLLCLELWFRQFIDSASG